MDWAVGTSLSAWNGHQNESRSEADRTKTPDQIARGKWALLSPGKWVISNSCRALYHTREKIVKAQDRRIRPNKTAPSWYPVSLISF